MTAVHNAKSSAAPESVRFTAQSVHGTTVVVATGELDASNINYLTDYARDCLADGRSLVLDLSRLDFLGAQGIRSLFDIGDECERNGINWALVPGHPVSRLLRICDPETQLPTVPSTDQALERFSTLDRARGLLQLVPKPG